MHFAYSKGLLGSTGRPERPKALTIIKMHFDLAARGPGSSPVEPEVQKLTKSKCILIIVRLLAKRHQIKRIWGLPGRPGEPLTKSQNAKAFGGL